MRTYVFENQAGTTRVEFVTDANRDAGAFTVMQIKGLSDAEERTGVNFRELNYTVEHFKTFASDNYLRLTSFTPTAATVLVEFDDISISTSDSWYQDNGV